MHLRLDPGAPARQHFCRGRDLAPRLAVELAAAGEPEIDRIAQPVQVDAGPAVDRAQKRHRAVGRRPAVVGCDAVEAGLDILARDGVDRAGEPVAQVALGLVAVELVGALRTVGIGRHILFEGISERGHAPGLGAFLRRIVAVGDLAEDLLCLPPRLVGRHLAVAADDDALVGRLPAAVAGTVVDDEGLGAAGMNTDAEAHELTVPEYRVLPSPQCLDRGCEIVVRRSLPTPHCSPVCEAGLPWPLPV